MRVIVVGPLKVPTDTKSGGRIHYLCKYLADSGINVDVFISSQISLRNSRSKSL